MDEVVSPLHFMLCFLVALQQHNYFLVTPSNDLKHPITITIFSYPSLSPKSTQLGSLQSQDITLLSSSPSTEVAHVDQEHGQRKKPWCVLVAYCSSVERVSPFSSICHWLAAGFFPSFWNVWRTFIGQMSKTVEMGRQKEEENLKRYKLLT